MLKEREPSMLEWGWSSVIFIGTVLLALVGDQCSLTYSNPELKVLYPSKVFLMCEVRAAASALLSSPVGCCT